MSTGLSYGLTEHSLLDAYNETLLPSLRVLQFSGDADPCVPFVGTERWIEELSLPVDAAWRPWTAPGTMAVTGYVQARRGVAAPRVRFFLFFCRFVRARFIRATPHESQRWSALRGPRRCLT